MTEHMDITSLLEAHYDTIFAFSVRALGCRHEAEDLTQDVCLRLAERLPAFRGDAKISTWLYRIVVNAAQDRLRVRTRQARLAEEWREAHLAKADEADAARAARGWIADTLAVLDPAERTTLALVVTGGFSQSEAAEILGVAPGTVSWRMSEIRKRLHVVAQQTGEVA
jgi:RNA polymerase sigma-70 factor (ECF subfamily)